MRNFFANYRGGAASRAGTAYCGMVKQGAPNPGAATQNNVSGGTIVNSGPPRDISFQFNLGQGYDLEFGDYYLRFKSAGAYILEAAKNVVGITNANPGIITITGHGYANGDWIYGSGIGGITGLNGLVWIVQNVTTNTFTLTDLFGNTFNSNSSPPYTSGGTFARIYTVTTPWAAVDISFLKYTQSADTMTLCCVNQITQTEYPPYDLLRNGTANWTLAQNNFGTSIAAPTALSVTALSSTTVSTFYSYEVTAVAQDGEESIASSPAEVENNDIAINAGSNNITWTAVSNAASYNVYAATPSYSQTVAVGVLYGLLGRTLSNNFTDTNIQADFATVPPTHQNPFARGQILNVNPVSFGSSYTQAGVSYTISTTSGTGAVVKPVVNSATGGVVSYITTNGGQNYQSTDQFVLTGDGISATANLNVGPNMGTYPGTVAYFQQRRVYANTLNNPDTYYMSQPGAFLNMDSSIPASDSDAIVGSPWSQQINGIQFMVPMPGGLVILTGSGAWQLTGGNSAAVTPANQDATPQAYNGCHFHVQPIVVNYDILYVQSKGSIIRDLSYNFFVNIYTGTDTTVLSSHLFDNHQIVQWCYAEEPYKIIWVVRDDGVLLSFTYLKEQDVYAWARHDTNGLVVSAASVTEPPPKLSLTFPVTMTPNDTQIYVDAVYLIVRRYVNNVWVYYSERMDNRTWGNNVEDAWCVDAGLAWPQTYPNATLTAASATGTSNITATTVVVGGTGYTAPVVTAVDLTGVGSGATFTVTLAGTTITAITPVDQGENYTMGQTEIQIADPTGSGAVVYPVITNNVSFTTSANAFGAGMIDDVIRSGGGIATITSYISPTQVVANITQPITATVPNDPNNTPVPQGIGEWTIGTPTSSVGGLNHLEGLEVAILADGSVVNNQTVTNNRITLPHPASQITIGLPFTCQLQTLYLDVPGQDSSQGKRKDIFGVTVRMQATRGIAVGSNNIDASTLPTSVDAVWSGLYEIKQRNALVTAGNALPLFSGDEFIYISADWNELSQVSIETSYPLPANISSLIVWFQEGDTSG